MSEQEKKKEITLPYIRKHVVLFSPGTWNGVEFSKESIECGTKDTVFTKENTQVFLNHDDTDVGMLVGQIENIVCEDGVQYGDLVVLDMETAIKLEYGVVLGISPKIEPTYNDDETLKSFNVMNYSIVLNPAIKDAYINENEVKQMEEQTVVVTEQPPIEASPQPVEELSAKVDETKATEESLEFKDWDTKYVNDLPDSCFMWIEDGGKKDADGKTEPRSLRHLPVKDVEGKWDMAHVRNALARLGQTKGLPAETAASIKAELEKVLEESKKMEDIEAKVEEPVVEVPVVEEPPKEEIKEEPKEEPKVELSEKPAIKADKELLDLNEQLLAALKESNDRITMLEKVNEKFKEDVVRLEVEITKFSEKENKEKVEKFNARLNVTASKYCKFFGTSQDDAIKMLSSYSEDMLVKTEEYITKKEKEKNDGEVVVLTQPSSQLKETMIRKEEYDNMPLKEKMNFLFGKIKA